MSKLHEVLAVDRDLENTAGKIINEAVKTFTKKTDHFRGATKSLRMFDENRKQEESGQEESRAMSTTVNDKLDYVAEHLARHIDCSAQKEATNQEARATVEIDGKPFIENAPATLLLSLENKLNMWRKMYETLPTLDPHITWEEDKTAGKNVYRAKDDIVKHKTEKTIKPIVMYEATAKHPAQIEKVSVDVPIGDFVTRQWSGMITPAKKSDMLGKIDKLLTEVKRARQRANSVEVKKFDIGTKIFNYINS